MKKFFAFITLAVVLLLSTVLFACDSCGESGGSNNGGIPAEVIDVNGDGKTDVEDYKYYLAFESWAKSSDAKDYTGNGGAADKSDSAE